MYAWQWTGIWGLKSITTSAETARSSTKAYPAAKFVFTIRHPLAQFESSKAQKPIWWGEDLDQAIHRVLHLMGSWMMHQRALPSATVVYEDLLAHGALAPVFRLLGMGDEAFDLDAVLANRVGGIVKKSPLTDDEKRRLTPLVSLYQRIVQANVRVADLPGTGVDSDPSEGEAGD